jgi:PAS domain S-box-containing protein
VDAATGRIAEANPAAERLFASHELVGRSVESLIPSRLRMVHNRVRGAYARRPRQEGHDVIVQRQDGTQFDARMGLSPIDGMVLAVVRER